VSEAELKMENGKLKKDRGAALDFFNFQFSIFNFNSPPTPLTRAEKRLTIILALIIAATRLLAMARSPWDWDELLFCYAVRDYDVPAHHPHPPGYPLFIVLARLARLVVGSDFRSLQLVATLAAMALFPVAFFLARELRFRTATALAGATLLSFLPNVWYYGGTAFSDLPGVVGGMLACALLLRGCRHDRAYVAGAVVLGLSAGIRTQNLLLALAPALIATIAQLRKRAFGRVAMAMLLGALLVGGAYGGAALASDSVAGYLHAVHVQQVYLSQVDSFRGPERPGLGFLALRFFVLPVELWKAFVPLTLLTALSLIVSLARKRAAPLLALATFGPFALFAWLMLSWACISRYAIGYVALHAFLAADGVDLVAGLLTRTTRLRAAVVAAGTVLFVAALAAWSWPALREVRTLDSPPVQAAKWIVRNVPPGAEVYVHDGLTPFSDYYFGRHNVKVFLDAPSLPLAVQGGPVVFIPEASESPEAINFTWPRGHLWRLARQRCFEVSVMPVSGAVHFGNGWYIEENGDDGFGWRWMQQAGTLQLPAVGGDGRFWIRAHVPVDTLGHPVTLTLFVEGRPVGSVVCTKADMEAAWVVPDATRPMTVTLRASEAVNPKRMQLADDARDLGLKLESYSWRRAIR